MMLMKLTDRRARLLREAKMESEHLARIESNWSHRQFRHVPVTGAVCRDPRLAACGFGDCRVPAGLLER
jgi:hypothetical protein